VQSTFEDQNFLMAGFPEQNSYSSLCARNWKGSERCVLCGTNEDIDHLLFNSPLASFAWAFPSEALGWQGAPRSLEDMMCNWTPRKFGVGRQLGLACFASVAWAVWHIRNNFCI
jgi:hypothetical protein